mgnify:CR=1 FL=1
MISGANVTDKQDTQFMNHFSLVLGILITIAIRCSSRAHGRRGDSGATRESRTAGNARGRCAHQAVRTRRRAGADNSALAAQEEPAAAPAAAAAQPKTGEEVYNAACTACHGAGNRGAPKFGDKAAWAPRIAKGMDVLHMHAIEGFTGTNGMMPPKGGRVDLSDEVWFALASTTWSSTRAEGRRNR